MVGLVVYTVRVTSVVLVVVRTAIKTGKRLEEISLILQRCFRTAGDSTLFLAILALLNSKKEWNGRNPLRKSVHFYLTTSQSLGLQQTIFRMVFYLQLCFDG